MRIRATGNYNAYDWEGLTRGQLLAVYNALATVQRHNNEHLTHVQFDLLRFLEDHLFEKEIA